MKKLFLVMPAVLLAVFMATSCKQGGGASSQEINVVQLSEYNSFIDDLIAKANGYGGMIPEDVKEYVEDFNSMARAKLLGIIIKDTQAGKPIARGTSKKDLIKRFHVKKV